MTLRASRLPTRISAAKNSASSRLRRSSVLDDDDLATDLFAEHAPHADHPRSQSWCSAIRAGARAFA